MTSKNEPKRKWWRKFDWPWHVAVLSGVSGPMCACQATFTFAKPLYLSEEFEFSESSALLATHFSEAVKLIGGFLAALAADSHFGKFKVIVLSYSLLCSTALPMYAVSSTGYVPINQRKIIFLTAFAFESITSYWLPTMLPFLSEQFNMPSQEAQLETFYVYDYMYLNLISAVLATLICEYIEYPCLGDTKCYPFLFYSFFLSELMYLIVFYSLRWRYKITLPKQNIAKDAITCIFHCLKTRIRNKDPSLRKKNLLDWADGKYDPDFIHNLQRIGKIITVLSVYFIFAILYYQTNTKFVYQASFLDGSFGDMWTMKPTEVEIINPVVIVVATPLIEHFFFPQMEKRGLLTTSLQRLGLSYLVATLSFVVAGMLQISVDQKLPYSTSQGMSQLRLYNSLNLTETITLVGPNKESANVTIPSYSMWELPYIRMKKKVIDYQVIFSQNYETSLLKIINGEASSYLITPYRTIIKLNDSNKVGKSPSLRPKVVVYCGARFCTGDYYFVNVKTKESTLTQALPELGFSAENKVPGIGDYEFRVNNRSISQNKFEDGAMYSLLVFDLKGTIFTKQFTIYGPNRIHILWIVPQYILISLAEILQYIASSIFVYTQAPTDMRAIVKMFQVSAISLAHITIGAASMIPFISAVAWFFGSAALLFVGTIGHIFISIRYKYESPHD